MYMYFLVWIFSLRSSFHFVKLQIDNELRGQKRVQNKRGKAMLQKDARIMLDEDARSKAA